MFAVICFGALIGAGDGMPVFCSEPQDFGAVQQRYEEMLKEPRPSVMYPDDMRRAYIVRDTDPEWHLAECASVPEPGAADCAGEGP